MLIQAVMREEQLTGFLTGTSVVSIKKKAEGFGVRLCGVAWTYKRQKVTR